MTDISPQMTFLQYVASVLHREKKFVGMPEQTCKCIDARERERERERQQMNSRCFTRLARFRGKPRVRENLFSGISCRSLRHDVVISSLSIRARAPAATIL